MILFDELHVLLLPALKDFIKLIHAKAKKKHIFRITRNNIYEAQVACMQNIQGSLMFRVFTSSSSTM